MNQTSDQLPANALKLFLLYAKDAGNWSGQPMVGGNVWLLGAKEDRALLTWCKRAGLLTTFTDMGDGCSFISFTDAGVALAAEHGIEVSR